MLLLLKKDVNSYKEIIDGTISLNPYRRSTMKERINDFDMQHSMKTINIRYIEIVYFNLL